MDRLNEIAEKCLNSILSMDGQLPLFQGAALQAIKAAMVQYCDEQPSRTTEWKTHTEEAANKYFAGWKESAFKQFYDRYGKKVGRATTFKKWMKLTNREIERIMDTVLDFVEAHPDPQFRPHPLTYLNQRRWEDEITVKKPLHVNTGTERNTWSY